MSILKEFNLFYMIIILFMQSTQIKEVELFIMIKKKTIFNIKDFKDPNSECTACEACVTVCPTHIDIRKGLQLECINCLRVC